MSISKKEFLLVSTCLEVLSWERTTARTAGTFFQFSVRLTGLQCWIACQCLMVSEGPWHQPFAYSSTFSDFLHTVSGKLDLRLYIACFTGVKSFFLWPLVLNEMQNVLFCFYVTSLQTLTIALKKKGVDSSLYLSPPTLKHFRFSSLCLTVLCSLSSTPYLQRQITVSSSGSVAMRACRATCQYPCWAGRTAGCPPRGHPPAAASVGEWAHHAICTQ